MNVSANAEKAATPLLSIHDLEVSYPPVAVRQVTLQLDKGEILGLVGESGCGKSSLARALLGMAPITRGEARLHGAPLASPGTRPGTAQRRRVQLLFQDSKSALSPRRTVRQSLQEPLEHLLPQVASEAGKRISEALESVGLDESLGNRYPGQLSGGQRQRVALARAIITAPDLVIADEPVSALDVTVQARILRLIRFLCDSQDIAFLFISHDLAVVRQVADRVAVMHRGELVEQGSCIQVLERPAHEYTRSLLNAVPVPDPNHPAPRAPPPD